MVVWHRIVVVVLLNGLLIGNWLRHRERYGAALDNWLVVVVVLVDCYRLDWNVSSQPRLVHDVDLDLHVWFRNFRP